jgi:hypothetical protein
MYVNKIEQYVNVNGKAVSKRLLTIANLHPASPIPQ